MTRTLPAVLDRDEARAIVGLVRGLAGRQESAVALLDDCDRAVRLGWPCLTDEWCAALATDPGALEAVARNALVLAQGGPKPARWTDGEHRPAEDVRRDLRARRTRERCVPLAIGAVSVEVRVKPKKGGVIDLKVIELQLVVPAYDVVPMRTIDEDDTHDQREAAERAARMTAAYREKCRKIRETKPGIGDPESRGRRFVLAAVDGELGGLAARGSAKGGRRDALNRAAFKIGQVLWAGLVDEDSVRGALVAAGIGMGLDETAARYQVASGLRAGAKVPRALPIEGVHRG